MGKRYYCNYCDRSFKDESEARKKHLSSLQHAKNRADHYSLFKDPETILREEAAKTPCKKFMTFGECAFGCGCKFSHYTPAMIYHLQQIVAFKNHGTLLFSGHQSRPNANEIIQEFFQDPIMTENMKKIDIFTWNMANELKNYVNLPPSLWPIRPETVTDSNFGTWGF